MATARTPLSGVAALNALAFYGGPPAVRAGEIKAWPPVSDLDDSYVLKALHSGFLTYGDNCQTFERDWASWNGNQFSILTNSGTAALHMGVAACGLGAGDHVIVPSYSWSSSATCVLHHNCVPVFVDLDFDTMNIDPAKIEAAITPRTKAILVVHLHGLAADMDPILSIARRHKLKVIEDCCQSHGALYKGRKVGQFGDCAAFSFNQNKSLCGGEGGMFVTNDEQLHSNALAVWNFGETRTPVQARDYHAYALGWMYRSNELSAAFMRAQFTRMDEYLASQRSNAAILLEQLQGTPFMILPTTPAGHDHTFYNFTIRIDFEALDYAGDRGRFRDAVVKLIQQEGVPAGVWQHFLLPEMTVFRARNAYGRGCPWSCPLPNADRQFTEAELRRNEVSYELSQFPAAKRHCDTHFGMTTPLRCPNQREAVQRVAAALRKVFGVLDKINADEVLAV